MKTIATVAAILIIFSATGCKEDEPIEKDFPGLETLEVTNISVLNGATFNAKITSGDFSDILEYGFVWSEFNNQEIDWVDRVIFTKKPEGKYFSADIKTTLKGGKTYYVAAFLRTEKYIIYGQVVTFNSKGSKAAVIEHFYPLSATWGDTIKIVGKGFSYLKEKNIVKFGKLSSTVFSASDTLLYTTVPAVVNDSSVYLSVSFIMHIIHNNLTLHTATSDTTFNYLIPEIFEITPMNGGFFDTINIIGNNLGRKTEYNKVQFNNHEAEIIYASDTLLRVLVPGGLNAVNSQIKVKSVGFEMLYEQPYKLNSPEITGFEPEEMTKREELIKIYGKNFSPIRSNNLVHVEGKLAQIIEASNDYLIIKTPVLVIPNYNVSIFKEVPIVVSIFNQTDQQNIDVKWHSTWFQKNDFPGIARSNAVAFTLGNNGYVGTGIIGSGLNVTNDFWKYDSEQDAWEQIASLPGEARGNAVAFTLNNHAYVGLGRNINGCFNDFYKYYPDNDTWEQMADFPGAPRHSSACFVINNIVWVGTGYTTNSNSSPTADLYKLNPISNSWHEESHFYRATGRAAGLNIGNSGYVYDYNALFKLVSGKWVQLNAPSLNTSNNIAFSLFDKAYFGLGYANQASGSTTLWEFDPVSGLSVNRPLISQESRYGAVVFTIDNKAFVVGGRRSDAYLVSVWEFDPTKPEN